MTHAVRLFVALALTAVYAVCFVALLGGLALAGTAAPYLVWNHLARHEEIGRLSLVMFHVPASGVALAAAVFGERFGPAELVGLAAVAAVAVIALVSRGGCASAAAAVHARSKWA